MINLFINKVKLLNHITYKIMLEFDHPIKISSQDLVIFKEVDGRGQDLSKSVNVTENDEVSSIFSSPSKCKSQ